MGEEPLEHAEIGCCFDRYADGSAKRAGKRETLAAVTAPLLGELTEAGLEGRTVLDLGCGVGDLDREVARRGAAHVTGIDLSRSAIAHARGLARQAGVEDRTTFEVGDGATSPIGAHDVVVMNRVVCCYPDPRALVGNALSAARSVLAFTAPESAGTRGRLARVGMRVGNLLLRLRPGRYGGFRSFVHDLTAIDARIRDAGFRLRRTSHHRVIWRLAVYERAAS